MTWSVLDGVTCETLKASEELCFFAPWTLAPPCGHKRSCLREGEEGEVGERRKKRGGGERLTKERGGRRDVGERERERERERRSGGEERKRGGGKRREVGEREIDGGRKRGKTVTE